MQYIYITFAFLCIYEMDWFSLHCRGQRQHNMYLLPFLSVMVVFLLACDRWIGSFDVVEGWVCRIIPECSEVVDALFFVTEEG